MPTEPASSWKPASETPTTGPTAVPWRAGAQGVRSAWLTRRFALGSVWLAFLGLCVMLVWVATWVSPPRDVALFVLGAGYEDNLVFPPDCAGLALQRDLTGIARTAKLKTGQPPTLLNLVQGRTHELRTDGPWDAPLNRFNAATLLLVVTGHGGADTLGAYVLPTDADARPDPKHRLRVSTILDRLDRLPPAVRIVLVFDVTQMPAHWPLGMVHNDFAHAVKLLEPRIAARPNLVVIVSSGESQLSWASAELGRTVFGHYFVEGLRGGAGMDDAQKINVWSLYRYTAENVSRWAREQRAAVQTPMLLPGGDEERARGIIVNVSDPNYQAAAAPTPAPLSPAWNDAWQEWQQLRTTMPHVTAPLLWRQYQQCLLHHETALRFGDTATASKKRAQLSTLAGAIKTARIVRLNSADATLAMPALGGATPRRDEVIEAFLKKFWDASSEEEARGVLDDAKKGPWKNQPLPIREIIAGIVERAALEKLAGLDRAAQRLRLIRSPDAPLPAEAHWLVMLARDLPAESRKNADVIELFTLALEVRRLAELSALGLSWRQDSGLAVPRAEEIHPWIQAALVKADEQRQLGSDLLLSSRAQDWQEARMLLTQAKNSYRSIAQDAEILRQALNTRDRLFTELTAYSHWLARRPLLDKPPIKDPGLDAPVKSLWHGTHELAALLQSPDRNVLNELAQRGAALTKDFDDVERRFDRFLDVLLQAGGDERHLWLETEAALLVPRPDLAKRGDLLRRQQRRITLTEKMAAPIDPALSAKRHARLEGHHALALLGEPWIARYVGDKRESYAQIQHRLERAMAEENREWQKTITFAGAQIGLYYRKMGSEIERLLAADAKANLDQHRRDVELADVLARRIEATLRLPGGLDPVGDARRLRLALLLGQQAKRTWQDHWYEENPTAEPYYRVVGRLMLGDARAQMLTGKRDRWSASLTIALGELGKKIDAPTAWTLVETTGRATDSAGKLVPDRAAAALLTSELKLQREFRIVPLSKDDRPPAGYPVLWPSDAAELRALRPGPLERVAVLLPATPTNDDLESAPVFACELTSPLVEQAELKGFPRPFAQRAPFQVRGLFRGQVIALDAPIDLHPEPTSIIKQFPLPTKASVAVRTDKNITTRVGTNDSGIIFVLDCSGSMRAVEGSDTKVSRYHQALAGLRAILRRVPRDTTISVITFGQAVGDDKTVTRPEQTINHALRPTRWDPQDTKQLDDLMATLAAQQPWNESPLSRALLFARADLEAIKGSRTVIAITDGHDNRFEQDAELAKRFKNVPELLKAAFDNQGISLHMIVFPTNDANEKKAIDEFRTIETFQPAGKVHSIRDIDKLASVLDTVLRQRLKYWIDRTGRNVTVDEVPESGLDVGTSDQNDRWFGRGLPPGGHKVRIQVPERVEKDILLHRGDLLLLDLVGTNKGIAFERYLFSDDYPWKRRIESKTRDWRLSVLQNQKTPTGGLAMLLALEKTVDRRETVLEQIKPREAWIELRTPPEIDGDVGVRLSAMVGYPAPAWSLDVPAWPSYASTTTPARPIVDVWWNPDEEARAGADLPLSLLLDVKQRPVVMKGEKGVVLESVTWEKHRVEIERGIFDWRECLVVRLRHDPNRPVLARLAGIEASGAEHRFYARANKAAALFWFDDPLAKRMIDQARLRLIAVAAFKEEAVERGFYLQIRDLNAPEPTDFRPRPPIELK